MAQLGLLQLTKLRLEYMDLSSVPGEHLTSLVASNVGEMFVSNVIGCDLVNIFKGHGQLYKKLTLRNLILEGKEVEALVQVMESQIETLELEYSGEKMTIVMQALNKYSGEGKCQHVTLLALCGERCLNGLCAGFESSQQEELETWAKSRKWHYNFSTYRRREKAYLWSYKSSIGLSQYLEDRFNQ